MSDRSPVLSSILHDFRACWKSLAATDVVYKVFALAVLTPLAGLLFRVFLAWFGGGVLSDIEILLFFLKPAGWVCLAIVGAVVISIVALEQAALLGVLGAASRRRPLGVVGALRFAARFSWPVLQVTARIVVRLLLVVAPFLAIAGAVYHGLLTEFDINYYLKEKPPAFWAAVTIGGVLAITLVAVLARLITSWFFALPLVAFRHEKPATVLGVSRVMAAGHRRAILKWLIAWLLATVVLSTLATSLVFGIGHLLVPRATGSLTLLSVAIGVTLILWFGTGVVVNLLSTIFFALILFQLYLATGTVIDSTYIEQGVEAAARARYKLTRPRLVAAAVLGVLIAGAVGVTTISTIRTTDQPVQIMAHRGASASAPENTLASVATAIEEKADWVEIDVQETADGQVVVFHDSDFKKLAGVPLKIWDATMDDLKNIDIGSSFAPRFSDQRVPTLAQVLDLCKGKIRVNIELKYYGHAQQLEQRVIDLVETHGMAPSIVTMSLKRDAVKKMKTLRPHWKSGLLMSVAAGGLNEIQADFLAVNARFAGVRFIKQAHAAGKDVYVWTVNDAPTMSLMISHGVDGIITDKPALARSVLQQRARLSPAQRLLLELAGILGVPPEIGPQ